MTSPGHVRAPARPLSRVVVTSCVCSAFFAVYGVIHQAPAPLIQVVCNFATLVSAVMWLEAEARSRGLALVHEWGFFAYLAWPVVIPWYVVKTRGAHGLGLAAFLYGVILAPPVLGAIIRAAEGLR